MNQKTIKNIASELRWKAKFTSGSSFSITSDVHTQTHVISIARNDFRIVDTVHELCHALLCERVHHLFSTLFFKIGTPEEDMNAVRDYLLAAQDWFVDHEVARRIPRPFRAHLREHAELLLSVKNSDDSFIQLGIGFCLAQLAYYKERIPIKVSTFTKQARAIRSVFLSVEPAKPNLKKLVRLTNELLQAAGVGRKVSVVKDVFDVFEIV